MCLCCSVGGEWVGGLDQGLEGWGGVISARVVSPASLCRWQVQVSIYCARRIPDGWLALLLMLCVGD